MKTIIPLMFFILSAVLLSAQKYTIEYSEDNGDKAAIKDTESGKLISPYQYDEIEMLNNWLGVMRMKKKYGLIDLNKGKIYCCDYDEVKEFDDDSYEGMKGVVKIGKKYGLVGIDSALNVFLPTAYNRIEKNEDISDLYIISKKSKFGIYSFHEKKVVVPCNMKSFPFIDTYGEYIEHKDVNTHLQRYGYYIVYSKKDKSALYDTDFTTLLQPVYNSIEQTKSTVFEVRIGKKVGLYDASIKRFLVEPVEGDIIGELVLNQYLNISVKNGKKWTETYIDTNNGKPILPLDYEVMTFFKEQKLAIIKKGGKYGIYDFEQQKIVVDCKYGNEDEILEKEIKILFKKD
jgi:hypothetical protein